MTYRTARAQGRKEAILLAFLGLGAAALQLAAAAGQSFGANADEAFCVILARSLRHGAFSTPGTFGVPIIDPLPGFPLLLAVPAGLLEPRWNWFWLLGLLPSLAAGLLAWLLARRLLSPWSAEAAGVLIALNCQLLRLTGVLMPDISYLAVSLLLFLGLDFRTRGAFLWFLLGSMLAALIKPQGVFLVFCLAAAVAARDGARRAAFYIGCALLPLALWSWRNHLAAGALNGYAVNWRASIAALGARGPLAQGLSLLGAIVGDGLLALGSAPLWLQVALGAAVLGAAGCGASRLMRGPRQALAFALASYGIALLALHATWPVLSPRYVIPLLPVFWILALAGLEALGKRGAAAALVLLAVPALWPCVSLAHQGFHRQPAIQAETMAWIRANTPASARFESLACQVVSLLAQRETTCPPVAAGRDAWVAALRHEKVDYVHVFGFRPDGYFPEGIARVAKSQEAWARSSSYFTQVYRNPAEGTTLFKLERPGHLGTDPEQP